MNTFAKHGRAPSAFAGRRPFLRIGMSLSMLAAVACGTTTPRPDTDATAWVANAEPAGTVGNTPEPVSAPTVTDPGAARLAPPSRIRDGAWGLDAFASRDPLDPLAPPAFMRATPHEPWDFTLSGTGSNDKDFDVGSGTVVGSIGYYFNDWFELSGRQNVSVVAASSTDWDFISRGAVDFHLGDGPVRPFVGFNLGVAYGDRTDEGMLAGPEAGIKFYVKRDVYILAMGEYLAIFDHFDEIDDAFRHFGFFAYTVGVGFRL